MHMLISDNIDKLIAIMFLFAISVIVRLLMQALGQRWICSISHTATLFFLPIITYTITNVISGNIALSLGMVGALSIVRFRNPVRSPLELTVYFGAITSGIVASVSLLWLIFFVFSVISGVVILLLLHFVTLVVFSKPFFIASFTEGNSLSILNVVSKTEVDILESSQFITTKRYSGSLIEYTLSCPNYLTLKSVEENLRLNEDIVEYQFTK